MRIFRFKRCAPRFRWWNRLCLIISLGGANAADWPQYRGPNHDGISLESIRTNWNEEPPRVVWKVPLAPALSSFAIAGGKAYTQARRRAGGEDREFGIALDANTGRELWARNLDQADYPNGGVGSDDGPRTTPAVDGDRVYFFTSYLRLFCLKTTDGTVVWSRDFQAEFDSGMIPWQNAASPIVIGDLVIVNGNSPGQCLMAFRKIDGALAWKGYNDRMTHASPVSASLGGVMQVIFYTQSGLVSVRPETGEVLWRHAVPYNSTSVAASAVVGGDVVYCSRAYAGGALAVRVGATGTRFTTAQVWAKPFTLMNHWNTPVHYKGHLYGMYGQSIITLKCVNLADGAEKWSLDGFQNDDGSVIVAGDKLLVLKETGDLYLMEPNPAAYTELARLKPLSGKCWNVPAVSDGRLYIRSTTEAVCLDVAMKAPPPLRLSSTAPGPASGFLLSIRNEDGTPLNSSRAAAIDIFATTDLFTNLGSWENVTASGVFTNGQLLLEDKGSADRSRRFFRIEESR